MAKRVLSIQVGNYLTRVALVEPKKKMPRVIEAFYIETPEHSVEDGYIRDMEELSTLLRNELGKRQIIEKNVMFVINCSRIITREITIPYMADSKISNAIDTQAKDFFPMDVSNYVISYRKLGIVEDQDKKKDIKLLLVAVPDNLLTNYSQFAESCAFSIQGYDYVGNSVVSLISNNFEDNSIVVQFEEQTTIVSLIKNKKLTFQRVAPYGYSTVIDAVLNYPVLGCKNTRDAFSFLATHNLLRDGLDIEEYKANYSGDEDLLPGLLGDVYEGVTDAINYYSRVVTTALEYYKSQNQEEFHGIFHLVGDGSTFQGVPDLFESDVMEDHHKGGYFLLKDVGIDKFTKDDVLLQNGLLGVIGCTINPLNIMPADLRAQVDKRNNLHTAYLVLAGTALISVVLVLCGSIRKFAAVSQQSSINEQIASLAYIQDVYNENTAALRTLDSYKNFDNMTYTKNEGFIHLVEDLENKLPKEMTVQSISVSNDVVTLNLTCSTKVTAAKLLSNLHDIAYLDNVSVPSITKNEDASGNPVWQFSLTADYVTVSEEESQTQVSLDLPENQEKASNPEDSLIDETVVE